MALELTQRFRRYVTPYDVMQSLTVLDSTAYCPALQTIGTNGRPSVDRTSVPTVLLASVTATAEDNSGEVPSVKDDAITNIRWMVQRGDEAQGTDITLHNDWVGHFSIGTNEDKGKLFVRLNIPAGETWKIWMECDIADRRRGYIVPIHVTTDSVLLYSISDGNEQYTMSIDRPSCEIYETVFDQRLIYEYLVGLNKPHTLVDDGKTYLREVNIALRKGGVPMAASEYTIRVFRIVNSTRQTVSASSDPCISAILDGQKKVVFDLRFSKSMTYQIECVADGRAVAHQTYSWVWSDEMPTTDEGIVGGATYINGDEQTYMAKLNFGKGMLLYPTIAFAMKWYYRKPGEPSTTYVGSGEQQTYDIKKTEMFLDGEAEAVLEIERRGAFAFMSTTSSTSATADKYVDGDGNIYIEN